MFRTWQAREEMLAANRQATITGQWHEHARPHDLQILQSRAVDPLLTPISTGFCPTRQRG
jgi:hypothetical protein